MITFSKDTPNWIKKLISKIAKLLVPEWDIRIKMVSVVDPECDSQVAEVFYNSDYLYAEIKYSKELKNNQYGKEIVIHELLHLFFGKMSESASRLISNKLIKKTAWKCYTGSEEESIVKLSRVLIALNTGSMINFVDDSGFDCQV